MDHPRPGLKYLPVKEFDRQNPSTRFGEFTVKDKADEKLGKLEGFIIDVNSARPYYVVVNAAGWFRSKHVLVPIGHVALDDDSRALIADVPKERIKRFPGFDLDTFSQLTQPELDQMAAAIGGICCPDHTIEPDEVLVSVDVWAHYATPTWWSMDDSQSVRDDEARTTSAAGTER